MHCSIQLTLVSVPFHRIKLFTYISLNWYNPPLASRTEFFHSLSIR
jgi:hypothetical protein